MFFYHPKGLGALKVKNTMGGSLEKNYLQLAHKIWILNLGYQSRPH